MDALLQRRMFARSFLLQAFWNYERMQNLGFLYAFEPALLRAYKDPAARHAAALRHMDYFNTQPYMAGFILGVVAGEEEIIARSDQSLRPALVARCAAVKRAMASGMAALGDRIFWGAFRPACAAATIFLWALLWTLRIPHPVLLGSLAVLFFFNWTALRARWDGLRLGYHWQERLPEALSNQSWTHWMVPARRTGLLLALVCAAGMFMVPPWGSFAFSNVLVLAACWALRAKGVSALKIYAGLCGLGCLWAVLLRLA
ncbi:MAG: PTS system mannose/fructose/sorbose family transporter subunit IID [Elusimicrobiota bacterium]|jgi:mannose/fructose/N-acetylgalactosamine-specific phosphotransferase system component IID